jgi:predicted hydrocarbon binding protein
MHGVIFASFSDFVLTRLGPEKAKTVLDGQPIHALSEAYPDRDFLALVEATSEATGVEQDRLVHEFGVYAGETTFPRLYPGFFDVAGNARTFLLTVEDRIHELVRATIPNAEPPRLTVAPRGEDGVHIVYSSPRRLCTLLVGLVEGTARHHGERAEVVETDCMRRGDPACLFDVRLAPSA